MNFADPSTAFLAAAGGHTVKLFDASVESGDPCTLSYTPSPGSQVNSLKWNHTNLVVASAGDDKKISLWRKNGESMGTIPMAGTDTIDNIEETIMAISFSNKSSRYLCSGGSGQVVRIWDLQRKRCIKWLRGHTDTITGAMYNCKDEHLASVSLSGDVILHSLASGARAAEFKDPKNQVLRVLDYSRISRHLLVTAGDDGSVHLWDTTGRSPKVSWLKQHSAPTAGICFSPSNDKVIASVGLDKKLYTFDSGSRRHSFCIPYEAPFSSLAYRDDGLILAAGTSSGQVVFYDVRGKPEPLTVLRAFGNSEAVTSLCWQRSKPVMVNENNCTAETALLGGGLEDSILMPDPLPSMTVMTPSSASMLNSLNSSTTVETPLKSTLWGGGALARLNAPRTYNFKDDMEVFSPLMEVQPITPSVNKLLEGREGLKKDHLLVDNKPSALFPSSSKRYSPSEEGGSDLHPIFDWKASSTSKQDDTRSIPQMVSTPAASSKSDDSSITPPEAWGGERLSDKLTHHRQPGNLPSRFAMSSSTSLMSGSMFSGLSTSQTSTSYLAGSGLNIASLNSRNTSSNLETSFGFSEHFPFNSTSLSSNTDSLGPALAPRRYSTYAERTSTLSSLSDRTASLLVGSPKTMKTGAEAKDAPWNVSQVQKIPSKNDTQEGSSFSLQLFQRALEETLASFRKSLHEDMRNLHIEVLRQFHMQEMEMSSAVSLFRQNQAELRADVQSLREEIQQLRQLV
ncbi:hypothetical protein RHGRI_027518 [Rhododendron griersonianum]|uniref:NEDD1 n=1 Tax=Rhododendron griersonianum TaxID=479676 RepID=A0AAV6IZK1_9ERIC|nr:hypothetical protein RHGRI_027518 [Rhododendron griersonianum]